MLFVNKQCSLIVIFLFIALQAKSTQIDFRIAGFIPNSDLFRDIYGTINPSYQLEAACNVKKGLNAWGNFSYFNAHGNSIPFHNKTRLQMLPISAGLKYVHVLHCCFDIYAGAGLCYTWLKEKNKLCLSNSASNFGGIFKLGIIKNCECLRFSLFSDYQLQNFKIKKSMCNKKVNANGLLLGGAIGISF